MITHSGVTDVIAGHAQMSASSRIVVQTIERLIAVGNGYESEIRE